MMGFTAIADRFSMTEAEKSIFSQQFEDSEQHFPDPVEFLTPAFIRQYVPELGYRTDLTDSLCMAAETIRTIPELAHFAWHLYYRTFLNPEGGQWMPQYQIPDSIAGRELPGLLNLLVAVASVPLITAMYRKLGVPENEIPKHGSWLAGTIDIYRTAHNGLYGHSLNQLAWLRLAADGTLFRIGRLEYRIEDSYPEWVPAVYVSRRTGKITVLARDGWTFDREWHICSPADAVHRASVKTDGNRVEGIPLFYNCRAGDAVTLDLTEWEPIQAPWENVISIHIPGGGRLTFDEVKKSLTMAPVFFRKYLHREVRLFCCESWILNPEWQRLLPGSNLARFQTSAFHLENPSLYEKAGLFFIFGRDDGDPLSYPQTNTIQKAMIQSLKDKGRLPAGVIVIPAKDIPLYGHPELF